VLRGGGAKQVAVWRPERSRQAPRGSHPRPARPSQLPADDAWRDGCRGRVGQNSSRRRGRQKARSTWTRVPSPNHFVRCVRARVWPTSRGWNMCHLRGSKNRSQPWCRESAANVALNSLSNGSPLDARVLQKSGC